MKVFFDKEGVLNIEPESWKDDEQLAKWFKKNKLQPTTNVILFGRYSNNNNG